MKSLAGLQVAYASATLKPWLH